MIPCGRLVERKVRAIHLHRKQQALGGPLTIAQLASFSARHTFEATYGDNI